MLCYYYTYVVYICRVYPAYVVCVCVCPSYGDVHAAPLHCSLNISVLWYTTTTTMCVLVCVFAYLDRGEPCLTLLYTLLMCAYNYYVGHTHTHRTIVIYTA